MSWFSKKKLAVGWHATEDREVLRFFDGAEWKGTARLSALDEMGPLPFTEEARAAKTLSELIARQHQAAQTVASATKSLEQLGAERTSLERQIEDLRAQQSDIVAEKYLEEINLRDFPTVADGVSKIAEALKDLRAQTKQLVRDGGAISTHAGLAAFFDTKAGVDDPVWRELRKDISTLLLGIFNAECEAATRAMRSWASLNTAGDRINAVHLKLQRAAMALGIGISEEYFHLKHEETALVWNHLAAKAIERAEARAARERLKEETQAQVDYELALDGLDKELDHYLKMLAEMKRRSDPDGVLRFEALITDTQARISDIRERSANIRVGYVYVISNIGSFGEGIVKIGLTRRLEPMDRVRELSNASVPFRYDVHAIIFSRDAVSLETRLHHHFDDRRINRVNRRREFFRATPHEVLEALKAHEVDVVEWIEDPDAQEFRLTQDQERLELKSTMT
ncbi:MULTISPECIES: GIY-YIG nuclease family protein [Arthrobacter]|uniref:GIY-YIG nuclease family protein n=2 Tax=Arthrobacter TaxID=1663 RepID=A0ABU9KJW4_9MICC|nr:GIY-YIG nuclease family protein [Arthrobacter sp. YJM1]MDP5225869.1 DUF4041 domain-containing protein [Arthrobacter sp. YJM1]